MRTDSLRISDIAADAAKEYIINSYGDNFYPRTRRIYKSKNNAQDAHEAIRPSYMEYDPKTIRAFLSNDQYKLYKLIWDRFIASQMSSAIFDTVVADIESSSYIFRATGNVTKFAGYLSVYEESTDDNADSAKEAQSMLPPLSTGDKLSLNSITPEQHFTAAPARYTEASLIKALEEKGIGRPSTYTPTITTILQRGYVERVSKALAPTPLGEVTTNLMVDNFSDIVDYNFTANMETNLDEIESGDRKLIDVLNDFYTDFEKEITASEKIVDGKNYKLPVVETDIICEKCGSTMVVKSGRFGKFAACPNYPACKNTKPLDKDGKVPEAKQAETELQAAPSDIKCDVCGSGMVIRKGRYGSFYACTNYPKCNGTKPINKEIDVPCPLCGSKIVIRRGRNRTAFYSCTGYPNCKFTSCDTPTNEKCPECSSMLLKKRGKNMLICSNKKCSYKAESPTTD
jgi:DNA topoisomerase-1